MLLGAVVYTLKVLEGGVLFSNQGRLLHAAFLNLMRTYDSELSERLHDSQTKPFTVGLIRRSRRESSYVPDAEAQQWKVGQFVYWRVTGLTAEVVEAITQIPLGTKLKVGMLYLEIVEKDVGPSTLGDTGVITMADLALQVAALSPITTVTLHFLTPTSFRNYENDYPLPKPELVFGSLVDRWNAFSTTPQFDGQAVRQIAETGIVPDQWEGRTVPMKLARQHGVKCFVGSFTYNLRSLEADTAKIFVLLAEFARFAGVGRLVGQGLGRVE